MDTELDKSLILSTLESWVSINTGTDNLEGLNAFQNILKGAFAPLNAKFESIDLPERKIVNDHGEIISRPVAPILMWTKRPEVKPRILLTGHLDTVFSANNPFQHYKHLPLNRLNGPGACDMKGGLLVLLETLKLWEASPEAERIGWQVILNSDEEVGSPSSASFLIANAKKADVGLIFEPSFADGTLVSSRKGSATLTFIARGVAAHAGRDFHKGRSAVTAMSRFICEVDALNKGETTINFGHLVAGKAANIVPDLAICRVGIRAESLDALEGCIESIKEMAKEREIPIEIFVQTMRPPKPFDGATEKLFETLRCTAEQMELAVSWAPSGGVCDGNLFAAAGLPTIDTLGVIGGDIHTDREYVEIDSITQRIELSYRLLKRISQHGKNR